MQLSRCTGESVWNKNRINYISLFNFCSCYFFRFPKRFCLQTIGQSVYLVAGRNELGFCSLATCLFSFDSRWSTIVHRLFFNRKYFCNYSINFTKIDSVSAKWWSPGIVGNIVRNAGILKMFHFTKFDINSMNCHWIQSNRLFMRKFVSKFIFEAMLAKNLSDTTIQLQRKCDRVGRLRLSEIWICILIQWTSAENKF